MASKLIKRGGNPNGRPHPDWKPGVSGNPAGKKPGTLSKWSEVKLKKILDIMGEDAENIVRKIVKKALNDNDKDQAVMLKILLDRLIPATKAVEIHGLGGKELAVRVLVESVETFNHVRTIDADVERLQ